MGIGVFELSILAAMVLVPLIVVGAVVFWAVFLTRSGPDNENESRSVENQFPKD